MATAARKKTTARTPKKASAIEFDASGKRLLARALKKKETIATAIDEMARALKALDSVTSYEELQSALFTLAAEGETVEDEAGVVLDAVREVMGMPSLHDDDDDD